jgi:hypothetical protein
MDTGSYRIAMSIQWIFALILSIGLCLLPDSPRWYVKRGRHDDAAHALSRLRGQSVHSQYVKDELVELIANYRYEMKHMQAGWLDCFRGGWTPSSNLRRVLLGIALQMMQQWTGVNPNAWTYHYILLIDPRSTSSSTTSPRSPRLSA